MRFRSLSILLLFAFSFALKAEPLRMGQSPESLLEAGHKWMLQGDYDRAYIEFDRIKQHFSSSDAVPLAEYQIGICSLYGDHPIEAAIQFQRVMERFPASEYAVRALQMNTILYRLYMAPPAERRAYTMDPSFSLMIPDLDEPSGMGIDSKQNIYLSDKGKKIVYAFNDKGIKTNTMIAMAPYAISVDRNDQVLVANDMHVLSPGKDPFSFRAGVSDGKKPVFLEDIRSVAANQAGYYFIVSRKYPGILTFNQNREPASGFAFPKTFEYHKILVNARDEVIALDKDRKQLSTFGRDGKLLFTIQRSPKEADFEKIEDFAVDPANHMYLLTDNPRGVVIYSASGKLLRYIPSAKKGAISFEDARLITVSSSGTIYVLDKDLKRVLKIG